MSLYRYWKELKRRNVIKAGIAYLVVAWLITQVLSIVFPLFEVPPSLLKGILIVLIVGFPVWLIFSWIYELTPDGLRKTEDVKPSTSILARTGSKLNKVIIFTLSLAIVVLVIDRFTNKKVQVLDYGDKSIAVMAFADMSPNKDHEYFSDGISEELLNILAGIEDLKVISRTSSFSYKDKNVTAKQIGKELDVAYMLEGSIRKAGNTIRITTQLIRTRDGSHVWSNTYDRNLDSIFKIQDDIALKVSRELQTSLLGESFKSYEPSIEAYNLFLQAKYLANQNTRESLLLSEDFILKSIAADSLYAPAWDLLGYIHDKGAYNFSIGTDAEKYQLALKASKKAVELDPNFAEAYVSLGSVQNRTWDFVSSSANLKKALELAPNNAVIIGTAALYTLGDLNESVELLQRAIKNDPLIYTNHFNLGFAYYRMGQFNKALEAFNTYANYYPNSQILHYMKAMIFLAKNDLDMALAEIQQETQTFFSLYGKNYIYFARNEMETFEKLFAEFLDQYATTDPANTADIYAFIGQNEKAFEYLNKAIDIKDPVLLEVLTYPATQKLKDDPRWQDLLNKMNLPANHGF
jgi:TolB-like protein